MDSTNYNSVSYNTDMPAGYVLKPNEDEIYSYYIPTRIRSRQPVFGVEEIDIFGDKSPDELFGKRDPSKHIYLFSRLKKEKETHKQFKRSAGDGIWQCRQQGTATVRDINGKEIRIGMARPFKYKGRGNDEWNMREYCIEPKFHPNPENIVFCHVYNKKAKRHYEIKRNNEEFKQQKKRKRNNSNNHDHQPLLPEPPQAYYYRSNVDQAHPLVPQGHQGDIMQDFISTDYGTGDHGYIVQEPTYYPSTTETYNEDGDEWLSIIEEELMN